MAFHRFLDIKFHDRARQHRGKDARVSGIMARRKTALTILFIVLAVTGIWAAVDLWGQRTTNLRQFDPDDVARRETEMWRSYYDKERVRLFGEMAGLLRQQYRMPLLRSYVVGFHAAKAAFVFKEGKERSDYEKALPDLQDYYSAIRRISDTPFDIDKASRLELEWWIIHRQRVSHPPGDLDNALAELAGELYQMPAERFQEHGKYRAEAMTIRDDQAERGGVRDADWQQIDSLLHRSWRSLWQVVNH
jgi:hypothetical protein